VRFGNSDESKMTPPGFHVVNYFRSPAHGDSLLMTGLEAKNSSSKERYIEIHGAKYVSEDNIQHGGQTGRSFGCLAIEMDQIKKVISELDGGSLVYDYTGDHT
jgi:hypothetical protein